MGYIDAKKDALKALAPVPGHGSGAPTKAGKLPQDKVDVKKLLDDVDKAEKTLKSALDKAKSGLEKNVMDAQNVVSKSENSLKLLAASLKSENFGLDPKSQDDTPRIKNARDILTKGIGEDFDSLEEKSNELDSIEDAIGGLGDSAE